MGVTASKIWIKTRKIVGSAFKLRSSFTRVEGGDRRPQSAVWRVGGMANRHETSVIKFKFNPRVCFLRLLFTQLYGPSYVKQILNGVKNSNDSTGTRHDNFSTCIASCWHSEWLVCEKAEEGGDALLTVYINPSSRYGSKRWYSVFIWFIRLP